MRSIETIRIITSVIPVLIASLALPGCGILGSTEPDWRTPTLRGTIRAIEPAQDIGGLTRLPRILVEAIDPAENPHAGPWIWFSIDGSTSLRRERADGSTARIRLEDIEVGFVVKAWAWDGIIEDTNPQKTRAVRILVIDAE